MSATAYTTGNVQGNPDASLHADPDCRELAKAVSVIRVDPAEHDGRNRCDRCHGESRWVELPSRPAVPRFDSDHPTPDSPPGDVRVVGIYTEVRVCPYCELGFAPGARWVDHWPMCEANDRPKLTVVR